MPTIPVPSMLKRPEFWRFMGFVSSVIGLICYPLSSPLRHILGEWKFWKILLYGVGSSIICSMVLFAQKWKLPKSLMLNVHMGFLVLMLTSVYSFFNDKAVKGKPDILGLISFVAFAMMSFSLSRQIDLGFEIDLLNFFLGCLTVLLMKINLMLILVGAVFCYIITILRCSLDSEQNTETFGTTATDAVAIEIDAATRSQRVADHDSNSGIRSENRNDGLPSQSLRRRRPGGINEMALPPPSAHSRLYTVALIHKASIIFIEQCPRLADQSFNREDEVIGTHIQRIQQPHQSLSLLTMPDSVCRIQIKEMSCISCSSTVESALQALQGVLKVQVALATEEAQVHYNPNVVTYDQILEAIEDTGYEATLISSGQETRLDLRKDCAA